MYEVEVKVRVKDPVDLRRRLLSSGMEHEGPFVEEDTFYQHPGRDFGKSDEALRVRRSGERMELTYKGPRLEGEAKVREEHTVHIVDDPGHLLRCLGFVPAYRLRKAREHFRSAHADVTLDHLEGVGWFAEVELVGRDPQALMGTLDEQVRALGLADAPSVRDSYLALALAAGAPAVTRS